MCPNGVLLKTDDGEKMKGLPGVAVGASQCRVWALDCGRAVVAQAGTQPHPLAAGKWSGKDLPGQKLFRRFLKLDAF